MLPFGAGGALGGFRIFGGGFGGGPGIRQLFEFLASAESGAAAPVLAPAAAGAAAAGA